MRYSLALLLLALAVPAAAEDFRDEPEAHALYDAMLDALSRAKTLTFTSDYSWEARGREIGHCTYRAWLAKPNQFRLETTRADGKAGGILVGDGENLWIRWPEGRPRFNLEPEGEWEATSRNAYLREPAPPRGHSIAHQTSLLGAGMSMTILELSVFHGCQEGLEPSLDGVRGLGTEEIGGETFDVIEVSYLDHQRSRFYWLSRRDRLPRRLKQVVRVSYDIISHETWRDVRIDGDVDPGLFAWLPPEGWSRWRLPGPEASLLKPGAVAPPFRARLADGSILDSADLRGKVVWLVFWRVG